MNYIIFDLEATCGWIGEDRQSEIIEIGAVKLSEKLEVIDEFQSFVRPVINPELTEFCTKLTSITQADVDSAYDFSVVATAFELWCSEVPVDGGGMEFTDFWLCSWGFYDKKQLKQDCEHWSMDTAWINKHISIKHQHGAMLSKEMYPAYLRQGYTETKAKQMCKALNRGVGMKTALEDLGIPLEGTHHRGIDDARNISKIFVKIFDQLKFK
ncbi:sporulation inhibitor KapD [compost metagenome]